MNKSTTTAFAKANGEGVAVDASKPTATFKPVRKHMTIMTTDGEWETVLVQSTTMRAIAPHPNQGEEQAAYMVWREINRDGTPKGRLFYEDQSCGWEFEGRLLQ